MPYNTTDPPAVNENRKPQLYAHLCALLGRPETLFFDGNDSSEQFILISLNPARRCT